MTTKICIKCNKGNKILPEIIESHNIKVNNFINSTTKLL